jgi:tripartite-type tricarboxylate transporter receptor subunit TctC
MRMPHDLNRRHFTLGLAATLAASRSNAQAYPSRPIQLVVPNAPGPGAADNLARLFAKHAPETLKQPMVVENRAGSSGQIAMQYVMGQQPDGHILALCGPTQYAVLPLRKPAPFTMKNFEPVCGLAQAQLIFVIPGNVPATNFQEFVAWSKTQKGVPLANFGKGSIGHLANAQMAASAQIDELPVSYRGAAPIVQALLAKEVAGGFVDIASTLPHARTGTLRILGITGKTRSPRLPTVPTFTELGVAGLEADYCVGIAAPAGTPLAYREAVYNAAVAFGKGLSAMGAAAPDTGYDISILSPAEFAREIAAASANMEKTLRITGIKLDD